MLKIRLAITGKKKRRYFRIVLTEHTRPAQSGYMDVLGSYDPIKKTLELKLDEMKKHIANGAQVTERVAKLAYNNSKDDIFKKFFTMKEITRTVKNPDKFEK